MDTLSGIGVLDKAVALLDAVAARPLELKELCAATGLPRATAHRLATALVAHELLSLSAGRYAPGPRLAADTLVSAAQPVLARLGAEADESAQLYVRRGDARVCVAAVDRASGLRDTVPVGAVLPLTAGSGAQVLLAWSDDASRFLPDAAFDAKTLAAVRRRGWAESAAEREAGVASVSAPVRAADGTVLAAVCLSGPLDRLGRTPGRKHSSTVQAAAAALSGD